MKRSMPVLAAVASLAFAFFIISSNAKAGGGSRLDDQLAKATSQFKDGHYGLAVDAYQVALTYDRKSVRALNGLASSYDHLGRFDLARRYYGRALALDPNSPMTLNNVGYSMLMQRQPEEAMAYFQRAQSHEPNNEIVKANIELAKAEMKPLQRVASPTKPPVEVAKPPVEVVKEPAPSPAFAFELMMKNQTVDPLTLYAGGRKLCVAQPNGSCSGQVDKGTVDVKAVAPDGRTTSMMLDINKATTVWTVDYYQPTSSGPGEPPPK